MCEYVIVHEKTVMADASVRLLRTHRSFAWYWAGQSLSSAGSQVATFALPLVTAVSLQGGPREVGWVATAGTLPYLLFSLLAGHVLEGRPKRQVMIPADLVQAGLIASIPMAWWLGGLSVPLLVVVAFLAGTAALCFGVVGFSYVPEIVDSAELPAANRAIQGSRTVAQVAGPGIAGVLVSAVGAPVAMAVDAVSYLASAVGVLKAKPGRHAGAAPAGSARPAATSGLWSGLHLLWTNPYLRPLTLHAAIYNLASQIFTLNMLLWAVQQQHLPTSTYGVAIGAAGIGGLIGTATALKLTDRWGLGPAFVASLILSCGTPLLAAAWPLNGTPLATVLTLVMLVSGFGLGNANVYSVTLRQAVIAQDQLTRSAGAYTQVMYGVIPIGAAVAGLLGASLGPRGATVAGAAGLTLSISPMLTRAILTLKDPVVETR